jgi:hypothetical protein
MFIRGKKKKRLLNLQLGTLASSGGGDETGRISLRMVDRHVLTLVINTKLGHVNTNVVLVGKRVGDIGNVGETGQDLLLHKVEGGLDRGRVVLGKGIAGDLSDTGMDGRVVDATEDGTILGGEGPLGINGSGEDTIPGILEGGVFVSVETVESGTSGLEDKEFLKTRGDGDLVTGTEVVDRGGLDILTIANEGVGVRLTVNNKTGPLVLDDVNKGTRDVGILLQNVLSDLLTENFNVINIFTTLGQNVTGVLAGIYRQGMLLIDGSTLDFPYYFFSFYISLLFYLLPCTFPLFLSWIPKNRFIDILYQW